MSTTLQANADKRQAGLLETIALAAVVTLAFVAAPKWLGRETWRLLPERYHTAAGWHWYVLALAVGFGLLLTCGSWKRSGLCIGRIRQHWRKVLLVCSVPIALTAQVYPNLTARPFASFSMALWVIDPLAQELVFAGYLYGRLQQVAGARIHQRLPLTWAIVLTAIFFSLMHLSHLGHIDNGYLIFMLIYTFLGGLLMGLVRLWTGSILYGLVTHMAVNFIPWISG